jgi:hypothetical protein
MMQNPPFGKGGKGGIFRGEPEPEIPPAPFNKGGSKFTDGEFLQPTLKRSWPNKRGAAKAFMANVFALVEQREATISKRPALPHQ